MAAAAWAVVAGPAAALLAVVSRRLVLFCSSLPSNYCTCCAFSDVYLAHSASHWYSPCMAALSIESFLRFPFDVLLTLRLWRLLGHVETP